MLEILILRDQGLVPGGYETALPLPSATGRIMGMLLKSFCVFLVTGEVLG